MLGTFCTILSFCGVNSLISTNITKNSDDLTTCINNILNELVTKKVIYTVDFDQPIEKPIIRIDLSKSDTIWFKYEQSHVCIINFKEDNFISQISVLMKNPNINPRGVFIVVSDFVNSSLFLAATRYYWTKLIVIRREFNYYQIYGYSPYSQESANNPNVEFFQLSRCYDGVLEKPINFSAMDEMPRRWRNTTLTLVNNIFPPYTICPVCPKNRGIETEIFDIIVEKLKFSTNYTKTDKFMLWGFKINGSYIEVLEGLDKRKGEMAIGGFHPRVEEHIDFEMSCNHMEDGLHWLVPRAKVMPFWKRFSKIFSGRIYLLISILTLLITALCYFLYKQPFVESLIMLYQILIETSLPGLPDFRILTMSWICFCLVISTVFKSKLMDVISKNTYESQVNSLHDIITKNLILYIDPFIASFYSAYRNPDEEFVIKNYLPCADHFVCVNRTAFVQDCVTVTFQRAFEYEELFEDEDDGGLLMHLIRPSIYPVRMNLFFLKGYPMFQQINHLLGRIRSSGFIQLQYNKMAYNTQIALSKKKPIFSAEVLNLEQMQIAFFVWFVGVIISFITFLLEVCVGMVKMKLREVPETERR